MLQSQPIQFMASPIPTNETSLFHILPVPTQMDRIIYCLVKFQAANILNLVYLTTPANFFAIPDRSVL